VNCFARLEVQAADLLHDQSHKFHCENDTAKGFNQSSVAHLRCAGSLQPWMYFESKCIIRPLAGAPESCQQLR